jgi:cytochrome c oxidase subunit I
MHVLGLQGMPRRIAMYAPEFQGINQICTWGSYVLAISTVPFLVNAIYCCFKGQVAGDNPWNALTLEWQTTSPPEVENFEVLPVLTTGPYDYGEFEEDKEDEKVLTASGKG